MNRLYNKNRNSKKKKHENCSKKNEHYLYILGKSSFKYFSTQTRPWKLW